MPRRLRSDRLRLRPPAADDASAIFAFAGDTEVTRYLDWPIHLDLDDTLAFIDDMLWGWDAGDDYGWVFERAVDRQVVGTVGCQFDEHGAQFGYVLARSCWGQGLATEAATTVFDAARAIEDVHRFWATSDIENKASIRVLEKLGMCREGVLRRWSQRPNLVADGRPRDVVVYAWVR